MSSQLELIVKKYILNLNADLIMLVLFFLLFIGHAYEIFSSSASIKEEFFKVFVLVTYVFLMIHSYYRYKKEKKAEVS